MDCVKSPCSSSGIMEEKQRFRVLVLVNELNEIVSFFKHK